MQEKEDIKSNSLQEYSMFIERQFGNGVKEQNTEEENHSKTKQKDQRTSKEK